MSSPSRRTSLSKPSTVCVPRAPPEIIEAVVDELASDMKDLQSFNTLLRCSLVSRRVYWRSRMHVFREVNLGWTRDAMLLQDTVGLTCGSISGLVNVLLDNPALSERILSLRINPAFYILATNKDSLFDYLSTLLEHLPYLRTFALTSGSDPEATSLPWSWFPVGVQSAIEACCARPTIKCVDLRGVVGFPTTLIYSCSSSLTNLYLSRIFSPSSIHPLAGEPDALESTISIQRPPWFLQSLVCQNALPLLRSVIHGEVNRNGNPFSGLQHLNVAIMTHEDSSLLALLLRKSMLSIQKLEISFNLWADETLFDTDWIYLPLLQRLHIGICCSRVQDTIHFPPDVANLIYSIAHNQTTIVSLSIHATCQMTYTAFIGGETGILVTEDGDAWKRLGDRLASECFSNLGALRLSLSLILVQGDQPFEITREICKQVEMCLAREVVSRFDVPGRTLSLEICVQSLCELLPAMEEWH